MIAVIQALLQNEAGGKSEIFFRPDHGHQVMGDLNKSGNPG